MKDQARSREFYAIVLGMAPRLDVPGMTEFELAAAAYWDLCRKNNSLTLPEPFVIINPVVNRGNAAVSLKMRFLLRCRVLRNTGSGPIAGAALIPSTCGLNHRNKISFLNNRSCKVPARFVRLFLNRGKPGVKPGVSVVADTKERIDMTEENKENTAPRRSLRSRCCPFRINFS